MKQATCSVNLRLLQDHDATNRPRALTKRTLEESLIIALSHCKTGLANQFVRRYYGMILCGSVLVAVSTARLGRRWRFGMSRIPLWFISSSSAVSALCGNGSTQLWIPWCTACICRRGQASKSSANPQGHEISARL